MKRRALALIIAFLMMAQPVAGFAEDPVELDGVVAVDEGLVEDGTLDLDGIALDDAEGLLGNGADALSLDLALVSNDVGSAPLPFEQTAIVGDVRFTMTAAPDTFPANAALSVSAVEDEATLQAVAQSVATDGQHHVYAICVADETGAPLTPGAELPLVRVEGISGDIRVFAYDQEAQRADEIETENGAFKFEKSGLYDIVGEAPAEEAPAEGGEPAQPGEEAPAEGGEPAQPGEEAPAEDSEPAQPGEEAPAEGGEPAQPSEEVLVEGEAPAQPSEEVPVEGLSIEIEGEEAGNVELLPEDIQNDLDGVEPDPEIIDGNPTEALLPFEQSQRVNDVVVTVKADPGVFPANAQLSVKRVPTYKKRKATAAIDEVRDEDQNVAVSYTFDIKVIDPDTKEELQPAEGRTVSVSFALSEVSDENLETNVYHIAEAAGELVAESLEVTTENQETAVVETDGFSLYTVEFTYGDLQYVLPGDTSVTMDEILDALNLTGEVTAAEVSNSRLFSASDATGAWVVSALRPFTSTEWMKVTINDVVYKITVTDEIKPEVQYIDENGVTQETSATILAKEEDYKKYTWGATGTDSWYVVDEYIIIPDDPITVSGNVHLILKSSCQLTADMGIQVPQGSSLTIYADSENPDNMGILEVTAGWSSTDAGIGGGGNITINGGKVTVTGNGGGAGIGGDSVSLNGAIVINGGIVMATGDRGGAGIGGGNGGAGGSITINGGEVTAIGGSDGAGIGFGKDYNSAVGTTVSINGGKVVTSGKEGISKGKNGNVDILSVGPGLYVYDSANSDEKKWTPIDIIDGSYDRCAHMAVYNKVPALVAEHTVGQNTYPYYNADTPIAQFVQKGGTLTLHQNLTYSGTVFLGEHDGVNSFTLDLNGYGLINNSGILSEEVIDVLQGATFELIDSEPTRNHKYTLKDGMAVDIDKSGSKSFKGGYITGGASGGVYIAGNGQFTMNAGTIIGNGSAGVGPGVELDDKDAVFIMRGGSIIGNKARQGSGVYVDKGTFRLSGKPIIAENYGSNVYLNGSNRIDITGPLESGTSVYLTMQNVGVFTNGFDEHHTVGVDNPSTWPSAYFHSDATGVKVLLSVNETLTTDDNEAKLGKHKHDYTCKAATDDAGEQIIRITCANNDCGHEGATEYTLGLTVPDSWVYGNTVELASFLDAEALEAFNEAFDGDPSMQVTADNNLFFYEKADPDNALAAMPAAAGDYVVELRVQAMEGSGYISISEPFSISPKDLTINGLTAANKEYDGSAAANITGTATLEGVVGTDDVTLVLPSGDQTKAVFVDENGDEDANVGKNKAVKYSAPEPYTIEGNDVSNYNLVQPTGLKAEITAKPVSLVWDTTTQLIYNKKAQWPKVDVKASDLISGDSCEVSTVTGKEINAGDNYTATATALNNANYALPEDEGQLKCPFSIAPKPVDLVWGDTSLTYNGKEQHPTVTVKADDLIAGDECDVTVTGKQTNVGNDYTATASALTNPNYELPEEDPTAPAGEPKKLSRAFSISPKTASLKWEGTSVVYDGKEHVPAASVTNKESGDDCEVTVTGAQTEVGKYTATATQLSNGNYKLPDDNTVQFQIAAIEAELEWTGTSFNYDGETHGPKARVTNCVPGETCEVTVQGATSSAGNHTATATALSNVRYMLPEVKTQTFTIAPKTVGLTWTNTDLTYNKQSQAPTATATGLIGDDVCAVTVDGAKKDVGDYTATATKLSNTNYALPADQNILTQAFTISPKTVDLEWTYISRTYNGKEQSPTVTAKGVISGDKCTVTVEGAKKDVGTYTATATGLSNGNYALPNEATALTKTCEITPITVGLKWGNSVFVYDGGNHLPTATATGVISGDTCEVTVEGEAKDAGKHTATASGLSNGNYVLPAANIQDFNISKKTVGLEWGTTAFTYDGQSHAPTATATGVVQGDTCDVTVTGEKTAAGSYTATASALSNSNYALPKKKTQTFTINKKTVGLDWSNNSLTYNGENQTPTATATGLITGDVCTVTVTDGQRNAGNHTATATKLSNGNYALPDDPTQSYTIAPKELALAWGSPDLTYNGKDQYPEITMTGVISGDTCEVVVEGAQKNVGNGYQAKVTGLTNTNYILPKEPTNGGTQTGTTFTRTMAFSIAQKTAELKWEGTSVVYDGQKHAPTASVANVEAGDTCTVTVPDTYAQTEVGTYTATATQLSNENYKLPDNSSIQFQIAAIVAELEWTGTSFNYDGETHGPKARVTNCVPGETCEVTVQGATSSAGNHTATATALSNKNYMLPKAKTQAFTIVPKTVGLTWANTDLTYNRQSQAPTATATGLIGDDVCAVTVTGATNVGSYTATATGLNNSNYALPADQNVLTQAFTISPKTLDLEWKNTSLTYNGNEQRPTVTAKGVISGDKCTLTVEGAKKDVGTYTAIVTGLNNGNYALPKEATALTKTCEITPKTVGLKWESGAFVYDGKAHNLTATATGLISEDTCTVTVTGAAKDAGKHTATASALSNANYALPKANTKEFSISKKTVGLEWGTTAFTYDGAAQVPAATATGLIQGDACAVTVTGAQTKVGSYTATASALSNPNYALPTAKTQKFTIGKKTVGLTWSNTSLTYNGKTQTPTATATGLATGDTCTVTVTGGQKNAGSHTATATKLSNGNYALPEEATQPFTISPLTVGLSWSNTSLIYNGKEQLPAVKATGLASGDSCTVTVSGAAVNAGTHTATATALSNGNYGLPEKNTQTFTIAQRAVTVTASDQTIQQGKSIQDNEATLSGAVTGHVLKSVKLAADTAKNSITPSDAIIVDANGNDVTANYKISYNTGKLTVTEAAPEPAEDPIDEPITVKIDVKDCKITVKNQTYTGTERTPAVTVRFEKTKLKQGRDYSVAYTNNVAIGVATVTVKGKGAYTGSRKVNFKILPKKTAFSEITGGKRKITLKWKNPKNITGYQIQYSLKKSFSSYKTVKIKKASILTTTISGLEANKIYYVRIRTYKVVKGKAYCSAWSTPKPVETL